MKKLSTLFVVMMAVSLLFSISASADVSSVSYGGTYYGTLSEGQGNAYILPNASTKGTSVHIQTTAANTLRLHYYWSYNNTQIDLGTAIVNSTDYYGGSAYYQPGTLITVVERVPGSTTPYPSVSYSISFNPSP
jgi:hypothetical protein